jgi:tuftelin-interacting protein 11
MASAKLGDWEKHTKGIGSKILLKLGFKGRLGRNEDGISQHIDVQFKQGSGGLGFENDNFGSRGQKGNNIISSDQSSKRRKKSAIETLMQSQKWKKDEDDILLHEITSSDLVDEMESGTVHSNDNVILDMRSKSVKVIGHDESLELMDDDNHGIVITLFGQELLYNINTIFDLTEYELKRDSRRIPKIRKMNEDLLTNLNELEVKLSSDKQRLSRLEKIRIILERILDTIQSASDDISISSLCRLFCTIHESFKEEFHLFGILNLLYPLALPLLKKEIELWNPIEDPYLLVDFLSEWSSLLNYFNDFDDVLISQTQSLLETVIEDVTLSPIINCILNEWEVYKPKNCIKLFECLADVISRPIYENIVNSILIPKLVKAINDWNTYSVGNPLHDWILPWQKVLSNQIDLILPSVMKKLSSVLNTLSVDDINLLDFLIPWKKIAVANIEQLVLQSVMPRLVIHLRDTNIDFMNRKTYEIVDFLIHWYILIPEEHYTHLLLGELFPRWHLSLAEHLCKSESDFEAVADMYQLWKDLFSESLPIDLYQNQLELCLNMMLLILEDSAYEVNKLLLHAGVNLEDDDYFQRLQSMELRQKINAQLKELSKSNLKTLSSRNVTGGVHGTTFKQVVEAFAESHGLLFTPKLDGQMVEGKPLWQFGKCSCFIEKDVLFVKKSTITSNASDKSWCPIALEDLLKIAFESSKSGGIK